MSEPITDAQKSHNAAAREAAEEQLARGDLEQEDFGWLFGTPQPTQFLVPWKRKSKAHLWANGDTLCRMASTGGLSMSSYRVTDKKPHREICSHCRMISE